MMIRLTSRLLAMFRTPPLRRPATALKPRRGGLFFLAVFMGLSGILRLGDGVGNAFAETAKTETPAEAPSKAPADLAQTCEPDAGAQAMLAALRDRETRLGEQENQAAKREQTLSVARTEIDAKIAVLEAAEQKLAQTIALADQASEKDVAKLVAMYETMKPKDAARLFGQMAPDFAAGFLAQMRPETAAAVLAGLDPAKAYTISLMLAGRNANAPKI